MKMFEERLKIQETIMGRTSDLLRVEENMKAGIKT